MAFSLDDVLRKKRQQAENAERPKVEWFSLAKKNPVRTRFLQEFTEDSPTYDANVGKVLFLAEHVSPYDFKRRAECSYDTEGRCFACEMNKEETQVKIGTEIKNYPWSQKTNMYTYIVTEDQEVKVLSRPAPGSFFDQLHDFAMDDGEGSITKHEFKISKGPQRNDKWNVSVQLKTTIEVPDLSELVDLEKAVGRKIPYAEQKKFYLPEQKEEQASEATSAPASQASSGNFDW